MQEVYASRYAVSQLRRENADTGVNSIYVIEFCDAIQNQHLNRPMYER